MKLEKGYHCHECAPKEFRHTADLTGSHEFDASVMHSKAKRVKTDLKHHLKSDNTYGPRTNYNGGSYHGYHGDD